RRGSSAAPVWYTCCLKQLSHRDVMHSRYQVAVGGSGFGGAVLAGRLARIAALTYQRPTGFASDVDRTAHDSGSQVSGQGSASSPAAGPRSRPSSDSAQGVVS